MRNHWLDQKKIRNTPPIIVNWGPPPVIGCTVTVVCPTYGTISMPTDTVGILPTITICSTKEIDETSKINKGCFGEITIPSIVSLQSVEGCCGEGFVIGACANIGENVECFAGAG